MDATEIIIKPLITEKSNHQAGTRNAYAFKVHPDATKGQIKDAVEKLYEVKVSKVRTLTRKGKPRRSKVKVIHAASTKRAIVTLSEESKIELY